VHVGSSVSLVPLSGVRLVFRKMNHVGFVGWQDRQRDTVVMDIAALRQCFVTRAGLSITITIALSVDGVEKD
jgi:hypothetical protein